MTDLSDLIARVEGADCAEACWPPVSVIFGHLVQGDISVGTANRLLRERRRWVHSWRRLLPMRFHRAAALLAVQAQREAA